jgi:hypothetical protein
MKDRYLCQDGVFRPSSAKRADQSWDFYFFSSKAEIIKALRKARRE